MNLKTSVLNTVTVYLLFVMIGLELGLRVVGYNPPKERPQSITFYKPHDQLGWELKPGSYQFPMNTWGDTMHLTIDDLGERVTKAIPIPGNSDKILFVGGSFTMGAGLDDQETFAWKIQETFPFLDIRNLGVGGYGTYQSLQVLQQQFNQKSKPQAVIYGFIAHHLYRNVAEPGWLGAIAINSGKSSNDQINIPYVKLSENKKLIKGSPVKYQRIPFSKTLATSFMIERTLNNISGYSRSRNAHRVLEMLLLEMQDLCNRNQVPFYVNILHSEEPFVSELTAFLDSNEIATIDCNVPLNESNTFRDDGHPNEVVVDEWTRRIHKRLLTDNIVSL